MEANNSKIMTVKQFSMEYNIGQNKAYEIVHAKDFPMIKCGKKIIIIRDKVDDWLYSQIGKSF
ncbi:helix-turn-helix domain-containing protein [Paraclostridium sordellii]|uniref:helix-turn-helix domain-containing protein n=1 Tax=Paraclostridium sordellii TaxID=1505 RepID=UPI00096A7969|nr:helix-turn-helix domain-containing protein [Paeniclostridium sordellii]